MIETRGAAMRQVAVVAALALTLLLVLMAGTAGAHKRIVETNLQLKLDPSGNTVLPLSGKLTSERDRCEGGRTVNVTVNGALVATTTTLVNGDWFAQLSPRPAKGTTLIASTPGKFLKRSTKHRHKCASDFAERRVP